MDLTLSYFYEKSLILSFVLFLIVCLTSQAQTQKNGKLIGGGASIQFNDSFAIGLYPRFGYFIINSLVLGAQLPIYYSYGSAVYTESKNRNVSLGLSPFVRYYFGDLAKTRVFAGAFGGIDKNWQTNEGIKYSGDISNNVGLDLGIVHFLTDQVGLEAALNYYNKIGSRNRHSTDARINRFMLNFSF